jgi:transcriptional regulator with XRE-family HTH domain
VQCNNPTVRMQELGNGLRKLRTQAGFTLDDAASVIHCSASKLSRLETGHRKAPLDDIACLLGLYRADHAKRTRLLALAREADETGWLQPHPAGCGRLRAPYPP